MKKAKANAELRELAEKNGVNLYEIAVKMGVADSTVYRWFRTEMPDNLHSEVMNAILSVGAAAQEVKA